MSRKEEIIAEALKIIPREQCVTIHELLLYLPISKQTFYTWELDQHDGIKTAIDDEKVKVKQHLRRKWRDSDNATLQVAEMKLCASEEELDILSTNRVKADVNFSRPGIEIVMNIAGELDSAQEDQG
jgi:hypothetical protein